jgi:son of sevenless-like protein
MSWSDIADLEVGRQRSKNVGPSRKVAQLLGEHVPVPAPVIETPWYLGEDYLPSDIVFDDKGAVKAGTLRALVARLTPHGQTGKSSYSFFRDTSLISRRYGILSSFPLDLPKLHDRE